MEQNNRVNSGWVKLHRKLLDNPLWELEPFTKGQAWVDLILLANHAKGTISVRGNIVEIERGQVGWSEVTLSLRWRWSRNKTRRFLKWLKTKQQIEQQKNSVTSVITILNYDRYQSDDTVNETADDTAERQQTIQQKDSRRYTNKKNKEEKEEKEKLFNEFWEKYPVKKGRAKAEAKYPSARHVEIMQGLENYLKYWSENGTEKRFIPHPTTWLNGQRWEDVLESEGPPSMESVTKAMTAGIPLYNPKDYE